MNFKIKGKKNILGNKIIGIRYILIRLLKLKNKLFKYLSRKGN